MEYLGPSLGILINSAPKYLALLTGIVIALVKWRDHPQVSMLALVGLGLGLLIGIVGAMVSVWLPIELQHAGKTIEEVGITMGLVGLARATAEAVSLALVITAIFIGRACVAAGVGASSRTG